MTLLFEAAAAPSAVYHGLDGSSLWDIRLFLTMYRAWRASPWLQAGFSTNSGRADPARYWLR